MNHAFMRVSNIQCVSLEAGAVALRVHSYFTETIFLDTSAAKDHQESE